MIIDESNYLLFLNCSLIHEKVLRSNFIHKYSHHNMPVAKKKAVKKVAKKAVKKAVKKVAKKAVKKAVKKVAKKTAKK